MNAVIRAAYDELNIAPTATIQELESAYKDLAQVWHPDRFQHNPRLQAKAQNQFCKISDSYNLVKTYLECGNQDDPGGNKGGAGHRQKMATLEPSLLDLANQIKSWFFGSNVGAGPISVFVAWSLGSFVLIIAVSLLELSWNFISWKGPGFEQPGLIQIFTILLAVTTMSRLTEVITVDTRRWAVRVANLLPACMSFTLLNAYQQQLVAVAENRIKRQAGQLDLLSRTEPSPILFLVIELTVVLAPILIWTYNPLSDWARRCESWLTNKRGLPPWVTAKLPLFFTLGWIAYFACMATLSPIGLWRLF